VYLVQSNESGAAMGICGLLKRDTLQDVDLGIAFLPEFCSRGFASEAAAAVLGYGRNTLGLTRVVAVTLPENESSIRVVAKLGFRLEGTVRLAEDERELNLFAVEV